MSLLKRKQLVVELERRVRARRDSSHDLESLDSTRSSRRDEIGAESPTKSYSEDDGSSSESSELTSLDGAASISFGALAKAQAALARHGEPTKFGAKLAAKDGDTWDDNEAAERRAGRKDRRDFNRSSKHAPTEISSKKAVSRRRDVVPVIKRDYRDPRFEPLAGPVDDSKFREAYSFLDDYREDEMKELKHALKTSKDADAKERLRQALLSMESRKKAQMRKDKEQEVLNRHRKEEKDLVKQGKKPFYLKKAEQKKRVLLDQYGQLKGKQLDHVIERRRKKIEGKEKKKMPFSRRGLNP